MNAKGDNEMLTLPIKKEWFDMILTGDKKEEYREIKPYYTKRFQKIGLIDDNGIETNKKVDIALRNGYSANDPTMNVSVSMRIGQGKKEWGAEEGIRYYCIEINRIHNLVVNKTIFYQNIRG